jgi:hypothetical protein
LLVQAHIERADQKMKAEHEDKEQRSCMYQEEFQRALANKAHHELLSKNAIAPLEYKLNSQLLDNIGLSPQNKNVMIIPKFG